MGSYLNPGTMKFQISLNSQIYVDKSMLIAETNRKINTEQRFMCVSRPRRFGKSMAMEMLSAYYSAETEAHALFDSLKISGDPSYNWHINKYNVIRINMQEFLSSGKTADAMLNRLTRFVTAEIIDAYPGIRYLDDTDFIQVQKDVYARTGVQFVILIDEWDCLLREKKNDAEAQKKYLDFLRLWMKDQSYVALAYMTGILPIKKYGTHSVLNMFTEYSMTDPGELAPYFGFTEKEVQDLCNKYQMQFSEAKSWYDGYELSCAAYVEEEKKIALETVAECDYHVRQGKASLRKIWSMYNPKSVVEAMMRRQFGSYWNLTETYEALKIYIQLNMDGLKDAVTRMLTGESVPIDIGGFENDMVTFANKDDVLTLLVHLGYLSYNWETKTVLIPNKEVSKVYITSIERMDDWSEVAEGVNASKKLLEALWNRDGETVAKGIDKAHKEISILEYNDENSLSCCINLAFYYAKEYYNIFRELPSGKGFADVVFVPRPLHMDKPAAVIELKKDLSAEGAIAQIRNREYCESLKDYHGNLLLCGINYDSKTKTHSCAIEKVDNGDGSL